MAFTGRRCSHADMEISLYGGRLLSITDASWGVERAFQTVRGTGGEPYDVNKGSKNYTFNFTIARCELKEIFQRAKSINPNLNDLTDIPQTSVLVYFRDEQGIYCADRIDCFCFNKHIQGAALDSENTESFTVPVGKITFDVLNT